jgi:hypothetical protein
MRVIHVLMGTVCTTVNCNPFCVRSEVFTAVIMKNVFWDVTPVALVITDVSWNVSPPLLGYFSC